MAVGFLSLLLAALYATPLAASSKALANGHAPPLGAVQATGRKARGASRSAKACLPKPTENGKKNSSKNITPVKQSKSAPLLTSHLEEGQVAGNRQQCLPPLPALPLRQNNGRKPRQHVPKRLKPKSSASRGEAHQTRRKRSLQQRARRLKHFAKKLALHKAVLEDDPSDAHAASVIKTLEAEIENTLPKNEVQTSVLHGQLEELEKEVTGDTTKITDTIERAEK